MKILDSEILKLLVMEIEKSETYITMMGVILLLQGESGKGRYGFTNNFDVSALA